MLAALGRIGAGASKGAVGKKITSGVKAKTTKVSKEKLLGRGGSSTSMSSASPTTSPSAPKSSISTSTPVGGDPLQSINQSLTKIQTLLKGSLALDKMRADQRRKQQQQQKAQARESALEAKKPKKEAESGGGGGGQMSFMDRITNFLLNTLLGFLAVRAVDLIPKLEGFLDTMKGVVQTIEDIAGTIFNGLVTFIDWGYSLYDNFRGWIKDNFGEDGLKKFDELSEHLNTFLNATLIACLAILKFKGIGGLIGVAGKIGGGVISAGKALVGFVAGGGAVAAGIVAGVGLLASGLGEGAFQLRKMGTELEEGAKKRYEETPLINLPQKGLNLLLYKGAQFLNFNLLGIGTLLDIVGAPFRYAVELIRYPFLSDEGRMKQRKNLAKFDARIREQIRQGLEIATFGMFDFGGKGAFGGLFGDPDKVGEGKKSSATTTAPSGSHSPPAAPAQTGGADMLSTGTGKSGKAIYLHWTAGGYNSVVGPYHTVFTGDGKMHQQYPYTGGGGHTYGRNTNSVGLSVAAMAGGSGNYAWPTGAQLDSMAKEAARIAKGWGWSKSDINLNKIMTHGEAGSNLDGNVMHENYGPYGRGNPSVLNRTAYGRIAAMERWDLDKLRPGQKYGEGGDEMRAKIKGYMAKGGPTKGKGLYVLAERGREFIIDADSTAALEAQVPGFLYDLNKAKGREAVNVLRAYASYESGADETVVVPMPAMSSGSSGSGSKSVVKVPVGGTENSSFDTLYQGA
jgi:hypothetical protein